MKTASAQLMPKAQVANLIVKVENGVDEFHKSGAPVRRGAAGDLTPGGF